MIDPLHKKKTDIIETTMCLLTALNSLVCDNDQNSLDKVWVYDLRCDQLSNRWINGPLESIEVLNAN